MTIKYIVEPAFIKTSWFAETLEGMKDRANTLRYTIQELTENDLDKDVDILIIIGPSPVWVSKMLDICKIYSIIPIVVNCHLPYKRPNINQVLIDYDEATEDCIDYLRQCARDKIALFGVNRNSSPDLIKKITLMKAMYII